MKIKKPAIPKQLYAVAWVPALACQLSTLDQVLEIGGRIIDSQLSQLGAQTVTRCLNSGAPLAMMGGEYITINGAI